MRERTLLEDRLGSLNKIQRDLDDATTLVELGESEGDAETENEGLAQLRQLKTEGERRQLEALLSGEADAQRHLSRSPFRRRRHGELRLGADAAAHVCALGRAP